MIQTFEQHRSLLFSIAYRMIGSVSEAEDIVQETYLKVRTIDETTIQHPKAYLSQITTRLCLDYLKSARHQREVYVGPWLPEPLITAQATTVQPDKTVEKMDSVSMAFMLLIEALSPAERAVFLLREVFDYDYHEIAHTLGKQEATCRKLFSRAKQHLLANRPRYEHDDNQHERLLQLFLNACQTGNITQLESVLAAEVVITVDGGGQVTAATRPVYGRERVVQFLRGIFAHGLNQANFKTITVNNRTALLGYKQDKPLCLFMFENDGTGIQQIWTMRNPEKLKVIQDSYDYSK